MDKEKAEKKSLKEILDEINPFIKRKKFKEVSTARLWFDSSSSLELEKSSKRVREYSENNYILPYFSC